MHKFLSIYWISIYLSTFSLVSCSAKQGEIMETCSVPNGVSFAYNSKDKTNYKVVDEHSLPWKEGASYGISSPPGNYSHVSNMAHAWDFTVRKNRSQGEEIVASVDGCIAKVKRNATGGFGGKSNVNNVNYVVLSWKKDISNQIYPGENIESLYLHLDSVYPEIKPGVCVKRGTPLGITGCTGWCTGIHLHYQVQKKRLEADRYFNPSLPVYFAERPPFANALATSKTPKFTQRDGIGEETEQTVTEPTVTEPTVTEPTEPEQTVTEPTETGQTVTEPTETEQNQTEPERPTRPERPIPNSENIVVNTPEPEVKDRPENAHGDYNSVVIPPQIDGSQPTANAPVIIGPTIGTSNTNIPTDVNDNSIGPGPRSGCG